MEGCEVLGIGRIGNLKNFFFGGLRFRFVFSIVATLWTFHLVSVFRVSSSFSISPCCRVIVRRVCFRFDSLFLSTMIPERDPRRHLVGSQAAVPGRTGKRPRRHPVGSQAAVPGRTGKRLPVPSSGIAGSGPWQNWQEAPAPSGGTVVPGRNGR